MIIRGQPAMPWRICILENPTIIETAYIGQLSPAELTEAAERTLAAGREHGTNLFLGDCTGLTGGHSEVDLFWLAEWLTKQERPLGMREAVLLPQLPPASDNVKMWEMLGRNRGFSIQLFSVREAALAWLRN